MKIELNKISLILKRFSFENKMAICQIKAREIMEFNGLNILSKKNIVFPWENELFAAISILSNNEYDNKNFTNNGMNIYDNIIFTIRNYTHPELTSENPDNSYAEMILMALGLQQFKAQEDIRFRLYRYNYIFNFKNDRIDMKAIMTCKFNHNYDDISFFAYLIYFFFSFKTDIKRAIEFILCKYSNYIDLFLIERNEYISRQFEKIHFGIESLYYSFKYIYPYPFIKYNNKIYIPIPYLIIDASTESLLNRLTYEDEPLRGLIGKEVIEKYLFHLMETSEVYDDVVPECKYTKNKNKIDAPDVMVLIENRCVLFDCKIAVPALKLRDFDKDCIEKTVEVMAKHIKQIYKRIQDFGEFYYPFNKIVKIEKENIYGVVVLLEENYLFKQKIYEKASEILGIEFESPEMKYIKSNIKIVGLADIESASLNSLDYSIWLEKKRDDARCWFDITMRPFNGFTDSQSTKYTRDMNKYIEKIQGVISDTASELKKAGIIN